MSLLTVAQNIANEIGIAEPGSVVGSSDLQTKQILAQIYEAGRETKLASDWPELQVEYTFTLTGGVASYALPVDVDMMNFLTFWNRDEYWPLIGPITPDEWQTIVSGSVSSFPRERFRIKQIKRDAGALYFFLTPTPDSGDTGNTMVFEYQSAVWFRPQTYATNTVYAAGSYAYDSISQTSYYTANGGTSNGAQPDSDTGITDWTTFASGTYTTFTSDNDEFLLPEDLIELGAKWLFKEMKGLPYEQQQARWQQRLMTMASARKSAPLLHLSQRNFFSYIGPENVPDTGYGS